MHKFLTASRAQVKSKVNWQNDSVYSSMSSGPRSSTSTVQFWRPQHGRSRVTLPLPSVRRHGITCASVTWHSVRATHAPSSWLIMSTCSAENQKHNARKQTSKQCHQQKIVLWQRQISIRYNYSSWSMVVYFIIENTKHTLNMPTIQNAIKGCAQKQKNKHSLLYIGLGDRFCKLCTKVVCQHTIRLDMWYRQVAIIALDMSIVIENN